MNPSSVSKALALAQPCHIALHYGLDFAQPYHRVGYPLHSRPQLLSRYLHIARGDVAPRRVVEHELQCEPADLWRVGGNRSKGAAQVVARHLYTRRQRDVAERLVGAGDMARLAGARKHERTGGAAALLLTNSS